MYSNDYYAYSPDGLTEQDIDVLIAEAFESAEEATAAPTSMLLDGPAVRRRSRRIERRAVNKAVRALPVRVSATGPDGQEAA